MPVLTITLIAAILLAVALPLLVYGLMPARAGVDPRRFDQPVPARAPGVGDDDRPGRPAARAALRGDPGIPYPHRPQHRARRADHRLAAGAGAAAEADRDVVALAAAIVFVVPAPSLLRVVIALAVVSAST